MKWFFPRAAAVSGTMFTRIIFYCVRIVLTQHDQKYQLLLFYIVWCLAYACVLVVTRFLSVALTFCLFIYWYHRIYGKNALTWHDQHRVCVCETEKKDNREKEKVMENKNNSIRLLAIVISDTVVAFFCSLLFCCWREIPANESANAFRIFFKVFILCFPLLNYHATTNIIFL